MRIKASVHNRYGQHEAALSTNGNDHAINIPPKPDGYGSSVNGGELLFLALATCYCNDLYREAAKRGIKVEQVEVEVDGEFGAEGASATDLVYRARVIAHAADEEIRELMRHTDSVAEIQNTLRVAVQVKLTHMEAVVAASTLPTSGS